jgi:ornithine carbamoyltransferase
MSTTRSGPRPRHLLDVDDLSAADLERVLDRSLELKGASREDQASTLPNHTLAMVFEKPSTRTRTAFETGMTDLGGHAIFLGPDDIGLGEREPLRDTARVLSGYGDALMVRLHDHADLEELAAYAEVPVVNGLTDRAHPCQTLADLLTIRETFGDLEGVRAAWVGDGNNVARSFALGCALAGVEVTVAAPEQYGLSASTLERTADLGPAATATTDPRAAVADADVVYTDVWVSMGESDKDVDAFEASGFQVNEDLLAVAATDAKVMHCLPADRGREITDAVLEGERSIVWRQAENRLHAQKGLLADLL